MNVHVKSDK